MASKFLWKTAKNLNLNQPHACSPVHTYISSKREEENESDERTSVLLCCGVKKKLGLIQTTIERQPIVINPCRIYIYMYIYIDNDMVNGTKLLNVTGISRGKRDGILKNERGRVVVKVGAMHLKGVW